MISCQNESTVTQLSDSQTIARLLRYKLTAYKGTAGVLLEL